MMNLGDSDRGGNSGQVLPKALGEDALVYSVLDDRVHSAGRVWHVER